MRGRARQGMLWREFRACFVVFMGGKRYFTLN